MTKGSDEVNSNFQVRTGSQPVAEELRIRQDLIS